MNVPTISAVVRVYNGERYINETLTRILAQTHPADEVVVVDDGSTDGTLSELEGFGDAIRVVRQSNQGHTAALNRCFSEAACDYVANCDADDLWEQDKLERQIDALIANPQIDICFGAAESFGLLDRPWTPLPSIGLLDGRDFALMIYRQNLICASSALIRRSLYQRVGPFAEALCCEDYDYWLRAVRARAVFYYDPHLLVRHREHDLAATRDRLHIRNGTKLVHSWHADVAADRRLVCEVLADDMNRIARLLVQEARLKQARDTFAASMRQKPTAFALAWLVLLSAPTAYRNAAIRRTVAIKRCLSRNVSAAERSVWAS